MQIDRQVDAIHNFRKEKIVAWDSPCTFGMSSFPPIGVWFRDLIVVYCICNAVPLQENRHFWNMTFSKRKAFKWTPSTGNRRKNSGLLCVNIRSLILVPIQLKQSPQKLELNKPEDSALLSWLIYSGSSLNHCSSPSSRGRTCSLRQFTWVYWALAYKEVLPSFFLCLWFSNRIWWKCLLRKNRHDKCSYEGQAINAFFEKYLHMAAPYFPWTENFKGVGSCFPSQCTLSL